VANAEATPVTATIAATVAAAPPPVAVAVAVLVLVLVVAAMAAGKKVEQWRRLGRWRQQLMQSRRRVAVLEQCWISTPRWFVTTRTNCGWTTAAGTHTNRTHSQNT
jgi:hypothetical protein